MDHHEEEEGLDAPQVQGVHEMPRGGHVPPARSHDGEDAAGDDDPGQTDHRQDSEHVDPGGHVGRLAVGEQTVRREGQIPRPRVPWLSIDGTPRSRMLCSGGRPGVPVSMLTGHHPSAVGTGGGSPARTRSPSR